MKVNDFFMMPSPTSDEVIRDMLRSREQEDLQSRPVSLVFRLVSMLELTLSERLRSSRTRLDSYLPNAKLSPIHVSNPVELVHGNWL